MQQYQRYLTALVLIFMMAAGVASCENTTDFPQPFPTQQPPANLSVSVQVDQEGTYITATFRGGSGQMLLKGIEVELIMPDGTNQTKTLSNVVGDSVMFTGSGCGDQIIATASFMNGQSYPILNMVTENIPGLCSADLSVTPDPCAVIAASPALRTQPIEEIPPKKSVSIQANVDIRTIIVEFRGGFGQNLIKELKVTRVTPEGKEDTQLLGTAVGDSVKFTASNNCLERIKADISFMDGTSYHFYDRVMHISRYT